MLKILDLKLIMLAIVAVFAPAQAIILTTLLLVVGDFISGIAAAKVRKEAITSSKMKTTVIKLLMYELTVMLAYLVGRYLTGPMLSILSIVSSVIGMTEFKSIIENLDAISGGSLMTSIVKQVQQTMTKPNDPL